MKCECCGEEFKPKEAYSSYLRHLTDAGYLECQSLYERSLCGICNRDKFYEWLEEQHNRNPEAAARFNEFWAWATDND